MRTVVTILIALHGVIHLLGFVKAFGLAEVENLKLPISKPLGMMWLAVFVLFSIAIVQRIIHSDYWWLVAGVAVVLSQVLIVISWQDAKYGTLLNVVILIAVVMAYSAYSFNKTVNAEIDGLLAKAKTPDKTILTDAMISDLPSVVQKWLNNSGAIGKEVAYNVHLRQELLMLMKPEQTDWTNATAKQYFTMDPPAFNWSVDLQMNPLMPVAGRDKFEDGKGAMTIKLFSMFPMVDVSDNAKVDQAALQRYLSEIVWFPSAAVSPYISWRGIDEHTAEATLSYGGTTGSATFHFDDDGNFTKLVAMRYKGADDAEPSEWTVRALKTEALNGIKVPVECEVDWAMQNGTWTWLKLKVTGVEYNLKEW